MDQKLRYNELGVGVTGDHCVPSSVSSCQPSCSTSISVSPNITQMGTPVHRDPVYREQSWFLHRQ